MIWNANVFCGTKGKIWWGDFDLVTDKKKLRTVARRLRNRLYLLREHDGRFEKENLPHRAVVKAAVWNTEPGRSYKEVKPSNSLLMNPRDAPTLPILAALNIHPLPRRQGLMVVRSDLQETLDELGLVYGKLPKGRLIPAVEVESTLAAAGISAMQVRERVASSFDKL